MRIGVIGSGMVGTGLASRLVQVGHEVRMGSRTADGGAASWADSAGPAASVGDFADAARFGELVINATAGAHSLEALDQAGTSNLAGKVLLDVANPIATPAADGPVTLAVANTDSLAEQIQRRFPQTRVVKSLNTMNADVMVHPELVAGEHVVFVSGDDAAAKQTVTGLLGSFGWKDHQIVDLGTLVTARGTEAYLLIWLSIWQAVRQPHFNIQINRAL